MNQDLVSIDLDRASPLIDAGKLDALAPRLLATRDDLLARRGPGAEFLGWLDLPGRWDDESERIVATAARLRTEIDTLVVVGIGGSYLGARALYEALRFRLRQSGGPRLLFMGHHLEAAAYAELLEELEGCDYAVNVISKSGTTTEPAIAFRLLRRQLEDRFGREGAARRILATTDAARGALHELAAAKGYERFTVPGDVGGRFSVLSPVGLFPLAVAGVDPRRLLAGAAAELERFQRARALRDAPSLLYAALRHLAGDAGLAIEVLASFHPSLHHLAEWWKQLFGESEGKDHQGLFPASVDYTTDLHSLGQYLQDGRRILLETFLAVDRPAAGPLIPEDPDDLDGLDYLAHRPLAEINALALGAVADAHCDGGVPNATVHLPEVEEFALGSLLMFFETAVSVSGRLLGVNPFDQPGVEAYKRNLFRVLGKPGA